MQAFTPESPFAHDVRPSPNYDERASGIDMLLLHYTGMATTAAAMARLCDAAAKVSAHYVIDEHGQITQLVTEAQRAWHAGKASWAGETDVNSCSIGVEIANPGHDAGYPDFPDRQIEAVIVLCADIVARHRIRPDRVLGHSDVAPRRKRDPGEKFPWQRLHRAGIGAWVPPAPIAVDGAAFGPGDSGFEVAQLQSELARYGYGIETTGNYDAPTSTVVTALQRHFRPARIDGVADRSTIETLRALLAVRGDRPDIR